MPFRVIFCSTSKPASSHENVRCPFSAELKEPGQLSRIRPEIFEFEPEFGLKLGQTKPKISGTVPTKHHTKIPNDSGPISTCFDDDPNLTVRSLSRLDSMSWRT